VVADEFALVRRLGILVESIHAVVYFAPEPKAAYAELGLRGYWRGYFASRAAPLGAAGPELVAALFGGFAPAMVGRAVPQVWSVASPPQVQAARMAGATAALGRLLGPHRLPAVAAAAELTHRCVQILPLPGRPMAAAQAALPRPDDPLAALWHDCTVLREHRGDGHLAAVAVAGWSGRNRTCCRVNGSTRISSSTGLGRPDLAGRREAGARPGPARGRSADRPAGRFRLQRARPG